MFRVYEWFKVEGLAGGASWASQAGISPAGLQAAWFDGATGLGVWVWGLLVSILGLVFSIVLDHGPVQPSH